MIASEPPPMAKVHASSQLQLSDGDWHEETGRWRDLEFRRLEALLGNNSLAQEGDSAGAAREMITPLIQALLATPNKGMPMQRLLEQLMKDSRLVDAIVEVEGDTNFGSVIELARQRRGAKALNAVINNPMSTVDELRDAVRREWWVFGGRYIPALGREWLPFLDGVDLPLIRSDGSFHLVALGAANVADLVVQRSGEYQIGDDVHWLLGRMANQLKAVQTQAHTIRDVLGVQSMHAFGTVVVGHPDYVEAGSRHVAAETMSTYRSRLSGLDLMTYKDLMDNVENTLDLVKRSELNFPER